LHPELPREATQKHYNDAQTDQTSTAVSSELVPKPGTVSRLDDYRIVMAQRALFQGIASMGLPAFTIHSIVRYSSRAMKGVKNTRLRTWGPIGLGLAAVPALPFLFDEPVEKSVEWIFHKGFEVLGGPAAVRDSPATGREAKLGQETRKASKEKEL
jgi:fission process protein 1